MKTYARAAVAVGAALVASLPAAASADTKAGGGTVHGGPCDVTIASITFDEHGNVEQVTLGDVQCDPVTVPPWVQQLFGDLDLPDLSPYIGRLPDLGEVG